MSHVNDGHYHSSKRNSLKPLSFLHCAFPAALDLLKHFRSNYVLTKCTFPTNVPCLPQVGRSRCYTPSSDDVGLVLKYEVAIVDTYTGRAEYAKTGGITTARVRPAPNPPTRQIVNIELPDAKDSAGRFSILSYNVLADLYASVRTLGTQPYCLALALRPWLGAWEKLCRIWKHFTPSFLSSPSPPHVRNGVHACVSALVPTEAIFICLCFSG